MEEIDILLAKEDYDAVFRWACEHHDWTDSPEIMKKVCECYRICMEQGNPAAALNLGTMYYNGTFLQRDYQQAVALYQIAAAAGEKRAICNLGYCYYYGRHQAPDYEQAFHYYNLGVMLFDDPNCLYKLGDMYRDGKYVEANPKYAVMLYFRAQEAISRPQEDQFCRADIQLRLGDAFLSGDVVERDVAMALDCFLQALSGFYERRKTDPYVSGLITGTKERIQRAMSILDGEIVSVPNESEELGLS